MKENFEKWIINFWKSYNKCISHFSSARVSWTHPIYSIQVSMYAKYGTIPATLNPFYSKIKVQVSFFSNKIIILHFVIAFIYKSALALSSVISSKSSFIFVTFNSLNTLITPSTASINSSFFGKSSSFYNFMSYLSLGSVY